jgi:DnaJ family protein C protein 9
MFIKISKSYDILSNENKKKIYDQTGVIPRDDENDEDSLMNYFSQLFEKVTSDKIQSFEKEFKNSEDEKEEIKKAYIKYEGKYFINDR